MKMDKRFLEKIKELKFLLVAISLVLFLGCAASETEEETTGISTEDTTKPTIESLSPDDGAQNIATNTTISATFSEDMDSSSISDSTFYVKVSGGASISGTVSYGSKTATFDPDADLSTSTDYEATVTTGMTDEAGNALDQKKIWTFTTGAGADSTPPTVSSKTPADGATGIAINTDLTVTFSEGMLAGSFTASTFTLNDGSGNVTGIISVDVDTVTFKPNTDLNNDATYTATITTGVQDAAGNALAANEVWSFTTGAERAQFSIKASNVQQSDVAGDTAAGDTIKNVDVTHQRGDAEITINRALESGLSDCFELSRNADGSLRISGNKDRTTDECQLELGDIITVKADGFIDKQIVVDESMLDSRGTKVPLKEIESVQNFRLADLQEGRISARSSRGAHVVVEDDIVHFKTNNGAVTLTMPIAQVQRMARNVKRRLKNATADTEIRVETTSNKNPKKELDSWPTLDFDPSFETTTSPHYQPARATKRSPTAAERSENALVTVGMANIQMKTDDGTEIHCFSGQDVFNEETQGCDDEESASLKMKVSDDLFEQYAKKYNLGERKVPLYSYNEDTAQWVRQTKNNVELDGELTLEDNNQDQKASAGDVLYIEGEVGHFSYWNGDYPMERSCLEGTITSLGGEPLPDGTQVVVEGSDYTGRKFTKPLKADSGDFKNIAVKKNALAQVYLSYPNGEKSDIVYVTTGSESFVSTGPCQSTTEVGGTIDIDLISALSTKEIVVTVVNQNGGPLEEAAISTNFRTGTTNSSGQTALVISKTGVTNVSASYNTGTYQATANIEVDGSDTGATITLDTRSFDIGGLVKFTDENSQFSYPQGSVSVSVYGTEGYSFGYSPIASNGQYLVRLPRNAIAENTKVYIYTYAYSTRYAKYLYEYVEIDVTASQITANRITQDFDFVMKPFRVSGRVFDPMAAAGSQGIAGVNIWTSSGAYTTTNEDGFYQLLLFENTQAQLIYAWDNEMWEYALPQTTTKNYITIAANNTADKIDQNFIASRTPALIRGMVISQKGVPVQGVQVFWSIGWKETETDADGRFEVKTFQELEGSVYVYSNWEQLAVSASATPKKGEITDIGEILVVSNMAPIMDSVRYTPPDPIAGQPLSVRVEARDPDNDHLTYSFTAKTADDTPIASLSDTTADSLEIASGDWPPGFNGGWIKIEISVSDHCETDPAITCETVTQSLDGFVKDNAPPIIRDVSGLISPYNQTTSSNMTLTVDAYDPEGSLLTYSAELYNSLGQLPTGWGSVVGTSTRDKGVITILNTIEDGDYSLRISVSDGSASRSTTRKFRADGNTAPGIQIVYLGTDTTADISNTTVSLRADGTPVSITVDAYDAQDVTGDLNIKWRLPAQFTGVSGTDSDTVMFTPAVGSFTAAVLVTDFGGLMASKTFDIDVKANRLPMVNLSETGWDITRLIKTADGTLKKPNGDTTTDITLTVIASDPEGDHLTFEFGDINTDLVSGVLDTNSATYSLSGLVPGRYAARYQVWDDAGAVADRTVTGFSIFEITLDRPPRLPEFFVPMKMKVSSNGNMLAVGEDPEGKALTFTWEAWEEAPGGTAVSITVDASNDTFSRVSFTAPSSQMSMFVRLTLSDGENSIYRERIVTVVSDRPPVISYTQVVPAVIKNSGKLFLFSEAYDEDDGLSNDPAPTWKIKKTDGSDATTDLFTGLSTGFGGVTVTKDATGDYNVWLEVVGGGQTVASSPVTVTIETANSSPSTPDLQINDKTLLPGETTSITASSSDPDGDEVSFEWRIDGVWQSDEVSDTITFSSDEPGDYTVAVQAYDGNTYSATSTDTITVQTLTLDLEAGPATIQQLGGEFTLTAAFSDGTPIPVDAATWTVTEAPAGSVAIISGSGASVAFTPDIAGPYTISLTVGLLGNAYTGEIAISTYTGPSLATIDGKVTDTLGNILSGARIRLYHQTDSSIYDQYATTDANGDYQFPGVPNGTYYLVVYAGNGFRTKTGVVTVGGPNEVDVKW